MEKRRCEMTTTQTKRIGVWIGIAVVAVLVVVGVILLASSGGGSGGGNLPGY
jgi:hypothetical protein